MESTSAPVVYNIPIFLHDFPKMIDVPYEWQILIVVLIAVVGFYVVLSFSTKTDGGNENVEEAGEEEQEDNEPVVGTPQRRRTEPEQLGTINTPDGRRSRRLANKRKEE